MSFTRRLSPALAAPFVLVALASCASHSPSTSAGGCKDAFPVDRTASEECCADWGLDACGAGLFCAAFDGRRQTTCYVERSRQNLEECAEDIDCASNSCNVDAKKCRGMQYELCDVDVGCAPTNEFGAALACVSGQCAD